MCADNAVAIGPIGTHFYGVVLMGGHLRDSHTVDAPC
jgi:hypothetical protein